VIVVRDLSASHQIGNPTIRDLVQQRINDLGGEAFDTLALGYLLVIEAGDTTEAIHAQVGFNILQNRFSGIRFDHPGFTPSFEFIQESPACYDMVIVLSDDGFGVELFIPKVDGVHGDLIAMCRMYTFKGDAP